ncbi:MAG: hypothetical protein ACRCZ9_12200 [Fusobacteriaceae bacterium]
MSIFPGVTKLDVSDKIMIFAMEGLDCVGKETYCKKLAEQVSRIDSDVMVVSLSFPDYSSNYGLLIKEELRKDPSLRVVVDFRKMYYYDMLDAITGVVIDTADHLRTTNGKVVLVCDRYLFSNMIYNNMDADITLMFEAITKLLPVPDLTLFVGANTDSDIARHKALLDIKSDKDENEKNYEIQENVSKYMKKFIDEYCSIIDEGGVVLGKHFEMRSMGQSELLNRYPSLYIGTNEWLDFENENPEKPRLQLEKLILKLITDWVKK